MDDVTQNKMATKGTQKQLTFNMIHRSKLDQLINFWIILICFGVDRVTDDDIDTILVLIFRG